MRLNLKHLRRPARKRRVASHRGAIYILVLEVAALVTIIGFSALSLARIRARAAGSADDWNEAGFLAISAVEHGVLTIHENPNWRTAFFHNVPISPINLGPGTFEWKYRDDADNDLNNGNDHPVRIYGTGRVGAAVRIYSMLYDPNASAMDVMRTTLHANDIITMSGSYTCTANGGPVSTNSTLTRFGTILADVEAVATSGSGTISGTITEPADMKAMPSASAFEVYKAMSTEIDFNDTNWGKLDAGPLISAAVNPYGAANPQGIYYIHVPAGWNFSVRIHRIKGTLLIDAEPSAKVKIEQPILWEPHDPAFPIAIIKAPVVKVYFGAAPTTISESVVGANLNPVNTPFNGAQDNSLDDTYPSELRGLIHVIGPADETLINNGVKIKGTLIVDGPVLLKNATITHDPALLANPPQGYGQPAPGPDPSSWRWEVLP